MVLSSPNLQTALTAFADYLSVRLPFSEVQITNHNNNLICRLILKATVSVDIARLLQECFALIIQAIVEAIIGRAFTEGVVHFEHAQPHYALQYSRYLHCDYVFSCDVTSFSIPLKLMNTANVSGDANSHALALLQCQQLVQQLPAIKHSTADQVRSFVLSAPIGSLNEADVAKALFVSKRTLARRLQQEQTSYREITEKLMSHLAACHLKKQDLSVETIALMMGYGDTAAFRKAFKRWFQQTPAEFRNNLELNS
ncbi:helix-turn-helix transcriptional regulator [Shewanella phaeophyticola]|uniref:AraC family transcriptional regulator n=1 Tax=Shewanella phaeophyticola TaxID=2978345 RepID=A0ABT2P4S5_9GAMM|nr:AraC family transcriptional regulator [Shewanella sp. KJ10-1]MCT8987624.1 AraC family transcriptional regulator [Shewanella sp. KJ10-1]